MSSQERGLLCCDGSPFLRVWICVIRAKKLGLFDRELLGTMWAFNLEPWDGQQLLDDFVSHSLMSLPL